MAKNRSHRPDAEFTVVRQLLRLVRLEIKESGMEVRGDAESTRLRGSGTPFTPAPLCRCFSGAAFPSDLGESTALLKSKPAASVVLLYVCQPALVQAKPDVDQGVHHVGLVKEEWESVWWAARG